MEEALTALATAGGTAVVQAAGTDVWGEVRARVARLLARGNGERERAELERLDRTASTLEAPAPMGTEQIRIRQESSWQTRFEALLEDLGGEELQQVVSELHALIEEQAEASNTVSAGEHGVAVGGDVNLRADHGSLAALRVGDVTFGNPSQPGPQ